MPDGLVAPLRSIDWDGAVLRLRADPRARLAFDLDGTFFDETVADADGYAHLAFAFAPGGTPALALQVRLGRDGPALTRVPACVRLGWPGWRPAVSTPVPLAPPIEAERLLPRTAEPGPVAVVIPVHNAAVAVEVCLDSVFAHTPDARVIVIDDASTDAAVAPLLARHAGRPRLDLLRNAINRGFTATANRGIVAAGRADVVLLNADTEVAAHWLDGLRRAAYSGEDVATATAVSDNAGAFSVPELEQINAFPPGWRFADAARALWQHAGLAYPQLPTGNGFCLYVRRSVFDVVGPLDEAAFPQGYGEENDFCQRASARGLRHLVAGNVLVRHARSQSFGEQRRLALGDAGMAVLRERWPNYEAEVGATLFSFERRVLDWRVRRAWRGAPPRPRVLCLGTASVDAGCEGWRLDRDGAQWRLSHDGNVVAQSADGERALWEWLQRHAFERIAGSAADAPPTLAMQAVGLGIAWD